jgi:putative redox protein
MTAVGLWGGIDTMSSLLPDAGPVIRCVACSSLDEVSGMSEHPHPTIVPHVGHKPTITVRATWAGEHRFDTGRPGGPVARLDGSTKSGQNPVDALVSALATCIAIDVVDILAKRRTPPERLVVDAHAERRAEHPRRVERVRMDFIVDGAGIEIAHTERSVALAIEKYCSVAATLAEDVVVETRVIVNGEAGAVVSQPNAEAAR